MKRSLTVRKEALAELSTDELVDVVGGDSVPVTITCGLCTSLPTLCQSTCC